MIKGQLALGSSKGTALRRNLNIVDSDVYEGDLYELDGARRYSGISPGLYNTQVFMGAQGFGQASPLTASS
jgi:hypothetical protein